MVNRRARLQCTRKRYQSISHGGLALGIDDFETNIHRGFTLGGVNQSAQHTMSDSLALLENTGGVAHVTLNRADKRNALSRELLAELLAAIRQVAGDESSRLLVLKSAGPVFCAGLIIEQPISPCCGKLFAYIADILGNFMGVGVNFSGLRCSIATG